jgi:hypothetical protein
MKQWRVAGPTRICGNCGAAIAAGTPMLAYHLVQVRRELVRCVTCAGEPVPADLPSTATPPAVPLAPRPEPTAPKRMARVSSLRRDAKQRQVGGEG